MADYTFTGLLASMKRRGQIPTNVNSIGTVDLMALATEELQSYVVELLLGVKEEYLVAKQDFVLSSSTTVFPIPARAIGGQLRDVLYASDGVNFLPVPRLSPETASRFSYGYTLVGNQVVFPQAQSSGTVRLSYFSRPNELVLPASCIGQVTGVSTSGNTYVVTYAVLGPSPVQGTPYDLVRSTPGFDMVAPDAVAQALPTGTSITFLQSSCVLVPAVGDYICPQYQSPVPMVPLELHSLLAARTVARALQALGDAKYQTHDANADQMAKRAMSLLMNRVQGSGRIISNINGPGWQYSRSRFRTGN